MTRFNTDNKYHAQKTWSNLIGRKFDSKSECRRAEQLYLAQQTGAITDLEFQVPFQLSLKPNVKIRIDFAYKEHGKQYYEDVKGHETREFRVKRAWIKEKYGIEIYITG